MVEFSTYWLDGAVGHDACQHSMYPVPVIAILFYLVSKSYLIVLQRHSGRCNIFLLCVAHHACASNGISACQKPADGMQDI
jgi:hypothetical protein